MPSGRPSSYKPTYCNEVVECLARGHSITAFAGEIGVARSIVFEWAKTHSEFKAAMDVAATKAVLFWEKRLISVANGEKVEKSAITAIIFGLKNRAHEDWRDVQKVEVGKPGEFTSMTDDELDSFITRFQASISGSDSGEEKARGAKEATRSRRLN